MKVMESDFLTAPSAQVVSSSLFKRCGCVLWKHSPVHLDLKYAHMASLEGQGQISGRQMQALSMCHRPLPLLGNKQVDYHSIHQCEVWTQREHLSSQLTFIQDKALFLPCFKVTYLHIS